MYSIDIADRPALLGVELDDVKSCITLFLNSTIIGTLINFQGEMMLDACIL